MLSVISLAHYITSLFSSMNFLKIEMIDPMKLLLTFNKLEFHWSLKSFSSSTECEAISNC